MSIVHKNLFSITLSSLIASVGRGLVDVFLPLLLLNRGLVLWQVCLFYVAYAGIKFCINYPCIRIINRYGARLGLIVGYATTTLYMVLLAIYLGGLGSASTNWAIWCLPAALAVQNAFLWSSAHLHISRVMDTTRKSRDLAMIENVKRIAGVATPFVGGLIALYTGQVWLVVVASVFVALAIVPVWTMDTIGGGHKPADNLRYSLRYAPPRDLMANLAFNFHANVGVWVWPIYLAVFVPNFKDIGLITTIASAIAVVVLYFAGKRGDQGKTHQVLTEGTVLSSLAHMGRIFASSNPVAIMVISAFYDVALSYQANPWASIYYHHAREKGINYILSMEIACDVAYALLWGLLGAIAYFTHSSVFFTVAFTGAALAAWGCLLVTRERREATLVMTPIASPVDTQT